MKNVEIKVEKDEIVIRLSLKKEFGPSKSGKTLIVASTEGNQSIPGTDVKLGLNVFKPNPDKPKS